MPRNPKSASMTASPACADDDREMGTKPVFSIAYDCLPCRPQALFGRIGTQRKVLVSFEPQLAHGRDAVSRRPEDRQLKAVLGRGITDARSREFPR
jgi:hypothetical protein